MRSHCIAMVLAASSLIGSTRAAPQSCPDADHYVYFSHDTYGYAEGLPANVQGPSRPCQAMKAVTEGVSPSDPSSTAYFTVRLSLDDKHPEYSIQHDGTVTVEYAYITNQNENVASLDQDFTFWFRNCYGLPQACTNNQFLIPKPCITPYGCAGAGVPFIAIVSQDQSWEPPELARMELMASFSSVSGVVSNPTAFENRIAGWVIQDECESGALFRYPDPLPAPDTQVGLTLQLATTLREGYTPEYTGVEFASHVGQNHPYAASEVVAETSWLDFTFALFDENAYHMRSGLPTYDIGGRLVAAPAPIEITFRFLGRSDWSPPAGCTSPPQTWDHYATQGVLDDFVVLLDDPVQGWTVIPAYPPNDMAVILPQGQSHLRMRFVATNNDFDSATIEVAHLHITDVRFVNPPPADPPPLRVGWSSDFRFLIQEDSKCPK